MPEKDDSLAPQDPVWRSLMRRFTRPRTLIWLGITLTMAVVFWLQDHRQSKIMHQPFAQDTHKPHEDLPAFLPASPSPKKP